MRARSLVLFALLVATLGLAAAVWARRPEDPGVRHYRLGVAAAQTHDESEATRQWQLALALNPALTQARSRLADAYLADGSLALAIREYRALLQQRPNTSHGYCRLADAYQKGSVTRLAELTARTATRLEPDCPRAHQVLGALLLSAQNYAAAQSELELALKRDPRNATLLTMLASLQLRLDRLSEAERLARQALQIQPDLPECQYIVAHCLLQKNDPATREEAVGQLKQVLAASPTHQNARLDLAAAYRAAGRNLASRWELEHLIADAPQNRAALQQLAEVLTDLGDATRAAALRKQVAAAAAEGEQRIELERRLKSDPTDGPALLRLGEIYLHNREFLQSIEMLERAGQVLGPRPDQQRLLSQARREAAAAPQ